MTISDFDDNAADIVEEAANDVTYVTLEDVKQFTAANTLKHSRLVQVQSYSDFDTWSCTNSSVCTEDGFSDPELEREVPHQDLQQPRKVGSLMHLFSVSHFVHVGTIFRSVSIFFKLIRISLIFLYFGAAAHGGLC